MKNSKRTIIFFCTVGISLTILGTTLLSSAKQEDPVLATVNGVPITQSQLTPLIEQYQDKAKKESVGKEQALKILQGVVTRQLILQQKESNSIRKEERIARKVKEFEEKLVVSAYLEKHVMSHLIVTNEEIKEYYKQNLARFASPPRVKARQILLRDRKQAEQIKEKLRKKEDFAKLAKEYSIDLPQGREGGSLGTIEKGRIPPELEKALFILNVGEISEIVETDYGFHILTVDEIITTQYRPVEEVSESIKRQLVLQKEAKAFDEMYDKLGKNAKVEIFEDRVQASQR